MRKEEVKQEFTLLVCLRAGDVFPFKGLPPSLQKERSNYYQKEVGTQVTRYKQILLNTTLASS